MPLRVSPSKSDLRRLTSVGLVALAGAPCRLAIVNLNKSAPVMMYPLDEWKSIVAKIVITHLKPTDARGRT